MLNISGVIFLITLLALTLNPIQCQQQDNIVQSQNPCDFKATCNECIQARGCSWCSDPGSANKPRCYLPSDKTGINESCAEEFIYNPDNEVRLISFKKLSKATASSGITQVHPQHISLALRLGKFAIK